MKFIKMGKWSDEQMFKFVQLYGYHSCLWDTRSFGYKNKDARQTVLQTIVEEMDIPGFGISECKIKIKNMRSHYCQELKKVKDAARGRNVYKPTLLWYETLDSFLRDYVQQGTNVQKRAKLESDNDDSEDFNPNMLEVVFSEDNESITDNKKNHYTFPELNKIKLENESLLNESNDYLSLTNAPKTEFDAFGCSVAAQLNTMPLVDAIELQLKIQQMITEERLRIIKNQDIQLHPGSVSN